MHTFFCHIRSEKGKTASLNGELFKFKLVKNAIQTMASAMGQLQGAMHELTGAYITTDYVKKPHQKKDWKKTKNHAHVWIFVYLQSYFNFATTKHDNNHESTRIS